MGERIDHPIKLKVCKDGDILTFNTTMEWKEAYERGIKLVTEPRWQEEELDYEYFADVGIMRMTRNHLIDYPYNDHESYRAYISAMAQYATKESSDEQKLIIMHVMPGTYSARILRPGMVVRSINGKEVSTLEEFREAFEPPAEARARSKPEAPEQRVWKLEVEGGKELWVKFEQTVWQTYRLYRASSVYEFMMTVALKKALKHPSEALRNYVRQTVGPASPKQKARRRIMKIMQQAQGVFQQGLVQAFNLGVRSASKGRRARSRASSEASGSAAGEEEEIRKKKGSGGGGGDGEAAEEQEGQNDEKEGSGDDKEEAGEEGNEAKPSEGKGGGGGPQSFVEQSSDIGLSLPLGWSGERLAASDEAQADLGKLPWAKAKSSSAEGLKKRRLEFPILDALALGEEPPPP